MSWQDATEWERNWWGDCANSFNEEAKQYIYAKYMGLGEFATNWYGRRGWDFGDKKVIDIGGGPCSILLKSKATIRLVVDPCAYPSWVVRRYIECGVEFENRKAEDEYIRGHATFDLALIYNCLQHTENPALIIANVKRIAKELRIFEWVDTGLSDGHLHDLTEENLNEWIGVGEGKVMDLNEGPVVGKAYFGIFPL